MSPSAGMEDLQVKQVVKAVLIKKVTVEQRLGGGERVGQAAMWGRSGPCTGPRVGVCQWRAAGWAEQARSEGRRRQGGNRGWSVPHRWHSITPPQRKEASTFSEALSDAVVRGASEGRGEAAKLGTHIGGTSAGPPSS